jgi:uncharacterized protein (TIGR02600 family)
MKNFRRPRSRSGFALILVLAVVVLLAALIVAFLSRVATERTTSSGYQASASVRALADNVTSLVEAQINIASTQGASVSWASQPGMVRTFDSSGNLKQAFKLYSSPMMILGSDSTSLGTGTTALTALNAELTADDVPTSAWNSNSALWTDLNAPVLGSNGLYNYPILDYGTGPGETQLAAPAGFSVTSPPGSNAVQPVPMPVHWLYVLQDGTLVAPTAGTKANSVNVAGDNTSNPIIGRLAFWTDDETCKINVNTASEGTFWDTPHAASTTDQNLANAQPAQHEYQRYPGHPAETSLSTVFSSLTPDQIYGIVPRVNTGGSNEGTTITLNAASITPDVDRLYDSLDELIFNSGRGSNAGLTRAQLEQDKFFLTAHSRAPELNVFNLPRIACWPVYALPSSGGYDMTHTTPFDRMIADCSTVNGQPYFFQREKYNDPVFDLGGITRNTQLYSYLQYLTSQSVPGYGGDFKTKYGNDRDQILTEIFDYIRCANLFDANATTPYTPAASTAGHGWVAPIHYQSATSTNTTMGFGRSYTLSEFGIGFICNADGNDTTLGSNNPTASVAHPVVNKVLGGTALMPGQKYIQAVIPLEFFSPQLGWTAIQPDMQVEITGLDGLAITDSAGTSVNLGFPADTAANPVVVGYNGTAYNINGGRGWGGNPTWRYSVYSMCSPSFGVTTTADATSANIHSYLFLGAPKKINASTGLMGFSGSGSDLVVKIYAGANGTSRSSANLLQTININLPASTFPIPKLVTTAPTDTLTTVQNWWSFPRVQGWVTNTSYSVLGVATGTTIYPGRFAYANGSPYSGSHAGVGSGAFFNAAYDVVRTVLPAHGDYRLVAGSFNVPDSVFLKQAKYDNTTVMMASNLTNSSDPTADQGYDQTGEYFPVHMSWMTGFDIPSTATGANTPEATGDFDNCLPTGIDGPFTNKPDEGNTYRYLNLATNIPYYYNTSSQTDPPATLFTPNRIMPSPGMFGSLSSGIMAGVPWRTLLFRPQASHFGATSPKDYLLMDLFWMPVVEPYAISDRFSTAGKINMNYQIVPFGTYITRTTGLQALFKSEKVTAVPNGTNSTTGYGLFKNGPITNPTGPEVRFAIDTVQTLSQFSNKFTNTGAANFWDCFRSPAEICDMHIVPSGQSPAATPTTMADTSSSGFWAQHEGTGDNMRERIYTELYPRLTTKSNTYTIHFRVQSLHKLSTSAAGVWTDGSDVVAAEYRGSSTIERYIDPNDTTIPDYASNSASIPTLKTLDQFYKWRIVSNHEFAP